MSTYTFLVTSCPNFCGTTCMQRTKCFKHFGARADAVDWQHLQHVINSQFCIWCNAAYQYVPLNWRLLKIMLNAKHYFDNGATWRLIKKTCSLLWNHYWPSNGHICQTQLCFNNMSNCCMRIVPVFLYGVSFHSLRACNSPSLALVYWAQQELSSSFLCCILDSFSHPRLPLISAQAAGWLSLLLRDLQELWVLCMLLAPLLLCSPISKQPIFVIAFTPMAV